MAYGHNINKEVAYATLQDVVQKLGQLLNGNGRALTKNSTLQTISKVNLSDCTCNRYCKLTLSLTVWIDSFFLVVNTFLTHAFICSTSHLL